MIENIGATQGGQTVKEFDIYVDQMDITQYDLYYIQRGMETGESWDIEHRLLLNDGTIHPDEISLAWVIKCDRWLFSHLTPYQRYLLYLYFTKNEGCVPIARRLNKSKDTVSSHLEKIYRKIGRLSNRIV